MNNDYQVLIDKIESCKRLFLYGAGIIGYGVFEAVKKICCKEACAFVVSDNRKQPQEYANIPIMEISDYTHDIMADDLILVATPPEYHDDIEQVLKGYNVENYVLITPSLEYRLMGAYLKQIEGISCIEDIEYTTSTNSFDAKVYMAVSHNDKPLKKQYHDEDYVVKIQVGKDCTDILHSDAELFDDIGDNISKYNELYGELTATYNVWKNYYHDITGIFHYRRTLEVKAEQLSVLNEGKVDVILPLPFVCYPDATGQYGRYLCKEDIDIMKDVLKEKHPELMTLIDESLNSRYLYNYNMLIAKREVFDDYCEWIFPLLQEITNRCKQAERKRFPRYIGRIGEILTSLYFSINIRKWKITHAPKIWLV